MAVKKLKRFNTETLYQDLMEPVRKMSHWNTFPLTKHECVIKGMIEGVIEGYSHCNTFSLRKHEGMVKGIIYINKGYSMLVI